MTALDGSISYSVACCDSLEISYSVAKISVLLFKTPPHLFISLKGSRCLLKNFSKLSLHQIIYFIDFDSLLIGSYPVSDFRYMRRADLQLLVTKEAVVIIQRLLAKQEGILLVLIHHQLLITSVIYFMLWWYGRRYEPFCQRRQWAFFGHQGDWGLQYIDDLWCFVLFDAGFLLESLGEEIAVFLVLDGRDFSEGSFIGLLIHNLI